MPQAQLTWVSIMHTSIEMIYNESRELEESYQKMLASDISENFSPKIGSLLLEKMNHLLQLYTNFCQIYAQCMLYNFQNPKAFEKLLNAVPVVSINASQNGQVPHFHFLAIQPVQRIPRYSLLVQSLIKCSTVISDDCIWKSPDVEALEKLYTKLQIVCSESNHSLQIKDNFEAVTLIYKKWKGAPAHLEEHVKVYDGELLKLCRKDFQKREFVLFEDIIIYGKRKSDTEIRFSGVLPLAGARVSSFQSGDFNISKPFGFKLITQVKSFVVFADSSVEYKIWLDRLEKAISQQNQSPATENLSLAPIWIPDSSSNTCFICKKKFSVIQRRHVKMTIRVPSFPHKNFLILQLSKSLQLHRFSKPKHCRKCGQLVDSSCCEMRNEVRMCLVCIKEAEMPKHHLTLDELSNSYLISIFQHLDPRSLAALSQTCKKLYILAQSDSLWKNMYSQNYGTSHEEMIGVIPPRRTPWKKFYQSETRIVKKQFKEFTLKHHTASVTALSIFPTSKRLLSASVDQTVALWSPVAEASFSKGMILKTTFPNLIHEKTIRAIDHYSEFGFVCGGDDESISFYDIENKAVISNWKTEQEINGLRLYGTTSLPSQALAAGSSGIAQLFDLRSAKIAASYCMDLQQRIYDIKIWGSYFLCGGVSKKLYLWDIRNNHRPVGHIIGHTEAIRSIVYNGIYLATGAEDGTVRVHDTIAETVSNAKQRDNLGHIMIEPSRVKVFRGHSNKILSLSSDMYSNRLASGGADGIVNVWNMTNEHRTVFYGENDPKAAESALLTKTTAAPSPRKTSLDNNKNGWIWSVLFHENALLSSHASTHSIHLKVF